VKVSFTLQLIDQSLQCISLSFELLGTSPPVRQSLNLGHLCLLGETLLRAAACVLPLVVGQTRAALPVLLLPSAAGQH
jgi:hypothetical protein